MSQRRAFNAPLLIALTAIVAFALDQWSKRLITARLFFDAHCIPWCGHKVLIPGWLEFAPIPNTHGAFGMFGSSKPLLVVMALIVLGIFWWSFREAAAHSRLVCIAFGLIVGGALGNIVDRVHYGYVIDFIDFYRFPQIWRFTFNVGDSFITIGVILLLISSVFRTRRHA
ncbi:MAG TPA: signal peptidase II [Candidatus Aquilonibacter sp.]